MADEENDPSEFRQKFEETTNQNRALQLENALLKAGVDTDTAQGRIFAQAMQNRSEIDVDALRDEWAEFSGAGESGSQANRQQTEQQLDPTLAAIQGQQEPMVPGASPEAMESLNLSEQAAQQGQPPIQRTDINGYEAARMEKAAAKEAGFDETAQQSAFFGTILTRAARGDQSVIWTAEKWNDHLEEYGEAPR